MRLFRGESLPRSVALMLVVSVGTWLSCVSGTSGGLAPPTDVRPVPQRELAIQLEAADDLGYHVLVALVLECANADRENDAIAERHTPVLE